MSLNVVCLVAFLMTVALIVLLRVPARQLGLVDVPGGRKQHDDAVPLVGGLAIFAGFTFTSFLIGAAVPLPPALLIGSGILVFVGCLDDIRDLPPRFRLLMQIVAAWGMSAWGGVTVTELGDLVGFGDLYTGYLAVPFTILCVVGLINAINMADGVDGLAGGVSGMAMLLLAIAAMVASRDVPPLLWVMLATLAAFLVFNLRHPGRRKASVFLGDAGSMMLGYALAWYAVDLSQTDQRVLSPISVAWILALPVIDTMTLMARRIIKRQNPFMPDREHFHHILQRAGLSPGETTFWMVCVSGILGAIGLAGYWAGIPDYWLTLGLLLVFGLHLYFVLHAWRLIKVLKRLSLLRRLRLHRGEFAK